MAPGSIVAVATVLFVVAIVFCHLAAQQDARLTLTAKQAEIMS